MNPSSSKPMKEASMMSLNEERMHVPPLWLSMLVPALLTTGLLYVCSGPERWSFWWAWFVLLAALGLFISGRRFTPYHQSRIIAVIRTLSTQTGLVTLAVGLIFLWHVPLAIGWPILLILGCWGVGWLSWHIPSGADGITLRGVRHTGMSFALLGALLGSMFLLGGLGILDLDRLAQWVPVQWWGIFIVAAGLVAVGNAAVMYWRGRRQVTGWIQFLLAMGIILLGNGVLELLGII